jgi:predicted MFS family arabinose efflux permease
LPYVTETAPLVGVIAAYGVVSGSAGVAIGVALAGATPPAARGVVMGGYSTALYVGLAIGSFAFGPVITRYGYATAFGLGALIAAAAALIAAALWTTVRKDVTHGDGSGSSLPAAVLGAGRSLSS